MNLHDALNPIRSIISEEDQEPRHRKPHLPTEKSLLNQHVPEKEYKIQQIEELKEEQQQN